MGGADGVEPLRQERQRGDAAGGRLRDAVRRAAHRWGHRRDGDLALGPCPQEVERRYDVTTITRVVARDIRFPTSLDLSGSDAMNEAPDYSAAYVVLETDGELEGHGFTFTIGRGNELCVAAIRALASLVEGRTLESFTLDMGAFWRHVTGDSQLRWVGPEKGVIHLATAAIVNAVWDLYAKAEHKPLWRLLSDMSPEELISCIDFRYITDAITREEALEILRRNEASKPEREAEMLEDGFPAYTTSAGWLGYSDERLRSLCARRSGKAGRISR